MVSATTVYRNGPANDPGYPEILLSDEPIVPHDGYKPQPNAPAWRDQCPRYTHCVRFTYTFGHEHTLTIRDDDLDGILRDVRTIYPSGDESRTSESS